MPVVPIGAALVDPKAVGEGLARFDAGKADSGHTIHPVGQNDAVPMNRSRFLKTIGHLHYDILALQPSQGWSR